MSPTALALYGCLTLLCSGLVIVVSGRQGRRNLRSRVLAAGELDRPIVDAPVANIRLQTSENRSLKDRILYLFGAAAHLPPQYGPSAVTLAPAAAVSGLLAWKVVGAISGPWGVLAGAGAALMTIRFLYRRKAKRYTQLLYKQIPDALSLMLRGVRAGMPLAEALRSVSREMMSPTRDEFVQVAGEAALGVPVEVAIQHLFDRTGLQEYAFLAVVVGLQGQTGGNLSETLENLADMVRKRVAMVGKARALAADGRISAIIVGSMPFGVAGLVSLFNPGYMREFFTNPRGPLLLGGVAFLLLCGLFSIKWLIEKSTQD